MSRWRHRRRHRHPANQAAEARLRDSRVARFEDGVTGLLGSGRFLVWQSVVIVIWIGLNVAGYLRHWDPYPFILLNLLFSTQAAYAAPLILMSQNRQAEHDRLTAEHAYAVGDESLNILKELLARDMRTTQERTDRPAG